MWPMAILDVAVTMAALLLLHPTLLEGFAIGAGVGAAFGTARWEIWRYRHPEITLDEYITDMRSSAPWN
jgi:hypothetical protein